MEKFTRKLNQLSTPVRAKGNISSPNPLLSFVAEQALSRQRSMSCGDKIMYPVPLTPFSKALKREEERVQGLLKEVEVKKDRISEIELELARYKAESAKQLASLENYRKSPSDLLLTLNSSLLELNSTHEIHMKLKIKVDELEGELRERETELSLKGEELNQAKSRCGKLGEELQQSRFNLKQELRIVSLRTGEVEELAQKHNILLKERNDLQEFLIEAREKNYQLEKENEEREKRKTKKRMEKSLEKAMNMSQEFELIGLSLDGTGQVGVEEEADTNNNVGGREQDVYYHMDAAEAAQSLLQETQKQLSATKLEATTATHQLEEERREKVELNEELGQLRAQIIGKSRMNPMKRLKNGLQNRLNAFYQPPAPKLLSFRSRPADSDFYPGKENSKGVGGIAQAFPPESL